MGGDKLYVSSWGWDNTTGDPGWRRWSVSWEGERKCFIVVPEDVPIETVMFMASAMFDDEHGNAQFFVRYNLLGIR